MKGFLIDTNVLSELRRPHPQPTVIRFLQSQPNEILHVSAVTFAEIRFGIERIDDPRRRADLHDWLERSLRPGFGHRCLAISEDILLRWRLMHEGLRPRGRPAQMPDLLIAATAAAHDLVVVSRDTAPFLDADVPILDPWAGRFAAARGDDARAEMHPIERPDTPDLLARLQAIRGR